MRLATSSLRCARLRHRLLVDRQRDQRGAVLEAQRHDVVELVAAGLEVDRVDDRAAGDLLERRLHHVGLGRVDLDRRRQRERDLLDELAHLLGLVLALGQRDAEVEHVRAALDLALGDLQQAVVVVGEQQLLRLREPCELTRSPTIVGRGSCASGVAAIIEETCGGRGARRAADGVRSFTRSAIARDVLGRRAAAAADDADAVALDELAERRGERLGLLGEDRLAVGPCSGRPAFGMQWTGTGE